MIISLISPPDYPYRYRILHSKQLLLDTTDTIGSIAPTN
jgi:hypothetical protein